MNHQIKPDTTMNPATFLRLASLLLLIGLSSPAPLRSAESYREPWRPQFHFTPANNWMNDPNGMFFYEGEYHLFYQFNPFGDRWGHMSWAHTVSSDLLHWKHLPIALYEDNDVMIFSGSAVVDWKNSSGFGLHGRPPLVAIYTGHYTRKPLQNQNLAYSNDNGRTWTKYSKNPVLDIGEKDFRDPKVFWHQPTSRWVMAVSWPTQHKVRLYSSPDLKEWTHLSDFGPAGSTTGIWECPDLFPVPRQGAKPGSPARDWVLIVNVGSGAPAGGSGGQYFVGSFDGKEFKSAQPPTAPALWLDWGRDYYAAVTWSDIPKRDGRRLSIGWMSNWEYANDVPTSPWRSAMSLPRELTLRETPDGLRLAQQPVRETAKLRGKPHRLGKSSVAEANRWLSDLKLAGDGVEISIELEPDAAAKGFSLLLKTGADESSVLRYQPAEARLSLDRTHSGRTDFSPKFNGIQQASVPLKNGRLSLRLFLDTSSIEVFADDGGTCLTSLVFPKSGERLIQLEAGEKEVHIRSLALWELKPSMR